MDEVETKTIITGVSGGGGDDNLVMNEGECFEMRKMMMMRAAG